MKTIEKKILFFTFCVLWSLSLLSAQTEEELDQLLLGGDSGDRLEEMSMPESEPPFSLSGSAAYESGLSLNENSFELNRFYRNQGRIKLKPLYETENTRAYGDLDFFVNSGVEGETRESSSLECVEAYVEGSGLLLWKIGKQRFNWGVGDSYQPTDLIDRPDLRDSFMRNNDDRYTGVYALSLKYLAGDYALEIALRPVTETALVPAGFYALEADPLTSVAGTVSPRYPESEVLSALEDVSAGIRIGGTSGILDWHLTGYSGMNKEFLYRSSIKRDAENLYIDICPVHKRMNALGADLSFALSRFNFRLEGYYSADMPALSSITESDITRAGAVLAAGADSVELQTVKHRDFFSYSSGFDINLWGNYGTVYCEWMQSRYIDEDGINPILQSDILMIRAEDSLFNQELNLSAGSMIRTRDGVPGLGINAEAEYDFKTGLTIGVGAYLFVSNGDEYIEMLEDKDTAYLKVQYLF